MEVVMTPLKVYDTTPPPWSDVCTNIHPPPAHPTDVSATIIDDVRQKASPALGLIGDDGND